MTAILNRDVMMAAHAVAINGAFIDSTVIKMMRGEQADNMLAQSYIELTDYVEKIKEAIETLTPLLPPKKPMDVAVNMNAVSSKVTVSAS